MFIASKLLAFLTQPLAWVVLILLVATRVRRGLPWVWTAIVMLLLLGWEPLPDALLRGLEAQYPPFDQSASLQGYEGVIVLGGALESAYVWNVPGLSALNDAAERMTEVPVLWRRRPGLKVLFTGGHGDLIPNGMSEAERALLFFEQQGISRSQILLEDQSRTTYENAVFSQNIVRADIHKPWLLVTSAWHMPRAMAVFRDVGWNVTACPVDFRSGQSTPWTEYTMDQGVQKWRTALHERVGMWVYRLSGRVSSSVEP